MLKCTGLTTILLLLLTAASAAAFGDIRYPDRKLNLRAARSATADWVGNLRAGQKVKVAFMKDGWVAVFEPSEKRALESLAAGYAKASFLLPEPTHVEAGTWGELMVSAQRLNIRKSASIRSTIVGKLEAAEPVKTDFPEDDWIMVFSPDATIRSRMNARGYCATQYLQSTTALDQILSTQDVQTGTDAPLDRPQDAEGLTEALDKKLASQETLEKTATPLLPNGTVESGSQTLVIDRTQIKNSKRPDPLPDKTAHGYQYRLLEKSETKKNGAPWITLKIFLSTTKLPDSTQLKDFCTTLWKEHNRVNRNLLILVFLPGMSTDDLAYGVVSFDDKSLLELYVRRVTLIGTKFL